MKYLFSALLVLSLTSCSITIGPDDKERTLLIWGEDVTPMIEQSTKRAKTLFVRETSAARFLKSHKIVFRRSPGTRGAYQYSQWVEPPAGRFTDVLARAIDSSGMLQVVRASTGPLNADYRLNTVIESFYHDVQDEPGEVVLEVAAEVVDLRTRELLSRRRFITRATADSYSALGARAAADAVLKEMVEDVALWIDTQLPVIQNTKGKS